MFEWLAKQKNLFEVMSKLHRCYKLDKQIWSQIEWCVDFFKKLPASYECQSVLKGKKRYNV